MHYMTTKDAAEKWGVTSRRVQQYCNAGKINGAIKMGNTWIVPTDSAKPADGRTKEQKELGNDTHIFG